MNKLPANEKGFNATGLLLVIVAIVIIVAAGWLGYKNHHKTASTTQSGTNTTAAACDITNLKIAEGGVTASDADGLEFTNTSSKTCTLQGYPALAFENSSKAALSNVTGQHGSGASYKDPGPAPISLNPNQTAVAVISFNEGGSNCVTAPYVKILLPDQTSSTVIAIDRSSAKGGIYFCASSPAPGSTSTRVNDFYSLTAFQAGTKPAKF